MHALGKRRELKQYCIDGVIRVYTRNMSITRHPVLEQLRRAPDACACSLLRKTSRVITQLYDGYLRPTGLTTAQFSLLAALYYVESVSVTDLAARLVMDRTTLSRSLDPLLRDGLVNVQTGEDRRVRLINISGKGLESLIAALPFWQRAQAGLRRKMRRGKWEPLQRALRGIVHTVGAG